MSGVIGIDIGTADSIVATVGKGVVDIVRNEVSERKTPSLVSFTDVNRLLGDAALSQIKSNAKNTCRNPKLLLGRSLNSPTDEADITSERFWQLCQLEKTPDSDDVGYKVNYLGQPRVFSAAEVLGALLTKLKDTTEAFTGVPVKDCVVAVPSYYTDKQRKIMHASAKAAGINVLRVMNEHTATALSYGIYRSNDFDEKIPTTVAFCSCGHSHFSVSIVRFVKGQLEVLAEESDRTVGGREMDRCIMEHFAKEFENKYKVNPLTNPRARFKLEEAATKCKKVLSANKEAPINVECLMDDYDLSGQMTRDLLEEKCSYMPSAILRCVQQALKKADLEKSGAKIDFVEIIGGASRVPFLQEAVKRAFGIPEDQDLSRTLNADECVARGCALQAAMLSPLFKVREFAVIDHHPLAIELGWKPSPDHVGVAADQEDDSAAAPAEDASKSVDADGIKWTTIYEANSAMNIFKYLSFYRREPFEVYVRYGGDVGQLEKSLGVYRVDVPTGAAGIIAAGDLKKVKVRVKLSLDGVFSVESARIVYEEEVEEEVTEKVPKKVDTDGDVVMDGEGADASQKPTGDTDGDAPMDAPAEGTEAAAPAAEATPTEPEYETIKVKKLVKKLRKKDIPVTSQGVPGLSEAQVDSMREQEVCMISTDREVRETNERKNDVEAYVYNMRDKVGGTWAEFVPADKVTEIQSLLDKTEDWLYDTYDGTKVMFEEKLIELQAVGKPIEVRAQEAAARMDAVSALTSTLQEFKMISGNVPEQYAHIDSAKIKKIADKCVEVEAWLAGKQAEQNARAKSEDPAFLVKDVQKHQDELSKMANSILAEPKPAPPPKDSPKAADVDVSAADAATAPEGEMSEDAAVPTEGAVPVAAEGNGAMEMD